MVFSKRLRDGVRRGDHVQCAYMGAAAFEKSAVAIPWMRDSIEVDSIR